MREVIVTATAGGDTPPVVIDQYLNPASVTYYKTGSGTVQVTVTDPYPVVDLEFTAPTFIVIRKEKPHKFTAVTDDVLWYCVFAIRDENGDVGDIVPETSQPYFIKDAAPDYWDKRKILEDMSIEVASKPYPPDGKLYEWSDSDWKVIKNN